MECLRRSLTVIASTAKSRRERTIPLTVDLVRRLEELRHAQAVALGSIRRPSDLVFLTPNGTPWCAPSNNVNRVLRRLLDRAGIERVDANGEKVDVHALRTTAASRLARNGVAMAVTQRLLGHADVRTTSKHYVRLDDQVLRDAIERIPPPAARQQPPMEKQG